jgi:hypothetical protein
MSNIKKNRTARTRNRDAFFNRKYAGTERERERE